MFKILSKKVLAPEIYSMEIEAPRIARSALPGQFIIMRVGEKGERIPLTVADYDAEKGSVTVVIQTIGKSTKMICELNEGDYVDDFAGPLGHPSELIEIPIEELQKMNILFIAGGVGTAPVYPQVKWMSEHGVDVDVIVGSKNSQMLIYKEEMAAVASNLYITTDDGSEGFKGLVTAQLEDLVNNQGKKYDVVVAIGPMIMMKFVALTTKKLGIKTIVSLNTLMVDGTGMCGACRVTVGGKMKFTCVDGPEFDAHEVDFDEAMCRQRMYDNLEERMAKIAAEREAGHKCRIGLDK
ncbi:MAG: sulfide/dihydroorotate dehydrogenase-like FAD/NAD-binding protein [Rikenellaceae bacterium]